MKKLSLALALATALASLQIAYGNMAAPSEPDMGAAVTLEENESLAVRSEVLDIVIDGETARITATYQMENTTDEPVSTQSMFLSPNMEYAGVQVTVDGQEVPYEAESFALHYDTRIRTEDWRYAVLTRGETAAWDRDKTVDTVTFQMEFEPRESCDVVVSYTYALGGYPGYDFNVKRGELRYYLTPAALWNGFEDLTINLTLGEDMPVLKGSSLEFEKVGERSYRYHSAALPGEDLWITVDENWYQNIFSTLRSPYLMMTLTMMAPFGDSAHLALCTQTAPEPALTVPQKEKPGRKAAAFLPGFLLCVGHMGISAGSCSHRRRDAYWRDKDRSSKSPDHRWSGGRNPGSHPRRCCR